MDFLSELSRRNVIRVAGLYAIMGWIIVQVIATVAPMLGLPEWFGTAVLLLLLAGFPIVALGAWAFEMTPEGLKRETSLAPGETARALNPLDIGILIGLVAVVAAALWLSMSRPPVVVTETQADQETEIQTSETEDVAGTSIAVLAFEDLSEEQDQEYFADGISEEILNVLVRVEGLQVASRTSSFQYKGRPLGVSQIADELGVGHVLEGSVRRAGDRVRITAQLIDARTDRHLWSENFDRDMTDIFEIQDEIADAIVAALADSLGLAPEEADVDVIAITQNLSAYDAFLEGRELFSSRTGLQRAVSLLERAVELDPEFVEAWAVLASTYVIMPAWEFDDRPYLDLAFEAANNALALDDTHAGAYAVLGAHMANSSGGSLGFDAFIQSFELFERALEHDPRNLTALDWYSNNIFGAGHIARAEEMTHTCLRIDPFYTKCRNQLVDIYVAQGRFEEALIEARRVISEGYPNLAAGMFDAYVATGQREQAMLYLGTMIGTGSPAGAIVDAIMGQTRERTDDANAQLIAYRDANPGQVDEGEYYYLAAFMGVDPLPEPTLDALSGFSWQPHMIHLVRSEVFRSATRQFGFLALWQELGFPDYCEPVGDDDFVCDVSQIESR